MVASTEDGEDLTAFLRMRRESLSSLLRLDKQTAEEYMLKTGGEVWPACRVLDSRPVTRRGFLGRLLAGLGFFLRLFLPPLPGRAQYSCPGACGGICNDFLAVDCDKISCIWVDICDLMGYILVNYTTVTCECPPNATCFVVPAIIECGCDCPSPPIVVGEPDPRR